MSFTQRSLGERNSAERDLAWSCALESGRLEGSKARRVSMTNPFYIIFSCITSDHLRGDL